MTTPAFAIVDETADYLARRRVADDLAAVREQWGDLLAAIERPPAAEWPPRDNIAEVLRPPTPTAEDAEQDGPAVGRMPLTLREHPAPLNLDALDAACQVESELFDLADAIAEQVQRPVRRRTVTLRSIPRRTVMREDRADRDDPARWHLATNRDAGPAAVISAGSRAFGLHWAAVWIEGRALDEPSGDLFRPMPPRLFTLTATTARRARRTVEKALNRDGRTVTLDTPCPWCGGELTGETRAGGVPVVTCSAGERCPAPTVLDRRRRTWRGADLAGLYVAMQAAREPAEE